MATQAPRVAITRSMSTCYLFHAQGFPARAMLPLMPPLLLALIDPVLGQIFYVKSKLAEFSVGGEFNQHRFKKASHPTPTCCMPHAACRMLHATCRLLLTCLLPRCWGRHTAINPTPIVPCPSRPPRDEEC